MLVGFCGASATGKSWVAGKLATQLGLPCVGSKAAQVAEETGFDVNAPHTFLERLDYQDHVLARIVEDMDVHESAIFDRTPLDLAAFSIIAGHEEPSNERLEQYINDCFRIAEKFDLIVLISPPYEQLLGDGEYKPGRLKAEIHGYDFRVVYDSTLKILLNNKKISKKVITVPENLHYEDRVDYVRGKINDYIEKRSGSTK